MKQHTTAKENSLKSNKSDLMYKVMAYQVIIAIIECFDSTTFHYAYAMTWLPPRRSLMGLDVRNLTPISDNKDISD